MTSDNLHFTVYSNDQEFHSIAASSDFTSAMTAAEYAAICSMRLKTFSAGSTRLIRRRR